MALKFQSWKGSSSAVIVGAIASAYEMAGVKASKETILNKAILYETHPDNIAPAVYGGFTSSIVENGKVKHWRNILDEIQAVMVIPDRSMSTAQSRTQLPLSQGDEKCRLQPSHASLLSAAFFSEKLGVFAFSI